ncbi:MAG: hypothetical protein IJK56_07135 [Firmicutes bacterium]|nr:hypothetical protein [Bacillota bacterium]
MKKTSAVLLAVILMLSMVLGGCDGSGNSQTSQSADLSGAEASKDESAAELSGSEGSGELSGSEEDASGTDASGTDISGTESGAEESGTDNPDAQAGVHTYRTAMTQIPTNWNPFRNSANSDDPFREYLSAGLYRLVYNDSQHPVEGKDPFTSYAVIPEMAASEPVDVTAQIRETHPEFAIPDSPETGYAYTIDLNPNAKWDDGTPITADTYVYSMQQLLRPELHNSLAAGFYTGALEITGAENYANQGVTTQISVQSMMFMEGLVTMEDFIKVHGDDTAYINWYYSLGFAYDFDKYPFDGTTADPAGLSLPAQDLVVATPLTIREMYSFYPQMYGTSEMDIALGQAYFPEEIYLDYTYMTGMDTSAIGLFKSGEYQITLVLAQPLSGFQLLYNLTTGWLVYPEVYEDCLTQSGNTWSSDYGTSVETTRSYGPYSLTAYESGVSARFERNDYWYGYTDTLHTYTDPTDGSTQRMYQTDAAEILCIPDEAEQKEMFLKGELAEYELQAEDLDEYRESESVYTTPGEAVFCLIFNGNTDALEQRELAPGFDALKQDLQTIGLKTFRQAVSLSLDKEDFAKTVSPSRSSGYGLIGSAYLYDTETGMAYRDTDRAKEVLCSFYSVDAAKYRTIDEAVAAITGYNPETAKELYAAAFNEAIAAGYVSDNDHDGICDQTITVTYSLSQQSAFITQFLAYMNERIAEITVGTPFEGRISFVASEPYDEEWAEQFKAGNADMVFAGWKGSRLDPFELTDRYVNPVYQFDAGWFDASSVTLRLPVNGYEVSMSVRDWSDALNGETVTIYGTLYNFGVDQADKDTRLTILAGIEGAVLQTYDYIPMLQDAEMTLLSRQVSYVAEDYNPVMSRGGLAYLRYAYDDAQWAEYVAGQGGSLKY